MTSTRSKSAGGRLRMKPAQMDAGTLADGWGQSHHLGLHAIPRICSSELLGKICVISVNLWLKAFISHRFHRWTQIKCYLPKSEIHSRDFILYLDLSNRTTNEDIPPTPYNVTTPRSAPDSNQQHPQNHANTRCRDSPADIKPYCIESFLNKIICQPSRTTTYFQDPGDPSRVTRVPSKN